LFPSDSHRVANGHLYYQDSDATQGAFNVGHWPECR